MESGEILQREVQAVMSQLCNLLSSSISLFNSPCAKYNLESCDSTSSACGIKGHVVLQEDTLCSMELMVKPTKTTGLIKSIFREDKQWKLQQIQDAINHLKIALNMISAFSDPKRNAAASYSKGFVIDILGNILQCINMCRNRLFSPCKLSLESLVSSGIVKMFTPALPGDNIVNFFILEDSLVITHYTVQQMHTPLSKSPPSLHSAKLFHPVGSVLEHAGTHYEIATALKSYCLIPWLNRVVTATDICLQLANQLKEKLTLG